MGLLPDTENCGLCLRRECRERFPSHRRQRKPLVSDPGMRHGTCVTHVSWCMSGSLTRSGGENVPGIPGTCATRNFAHLVRGPCRITRVPSQYDPKTVGQVPYYNFNPQFPPFIKMVFARYISTVFVHSILEYPQLHTTLSNIHIYEICGGKVSNTEFLPFTFVHHSGLSVVVFFLSEAFTLK